MRVPRLVAVALWLTVAALAVAGFAAFSPQSTPEPTTTTTTTTLPVRGAATGQVMARALAAGLRSARETQDEDTQSIVLDSLLSQRDPLPPPSDSTTTSTTAAPAVAVEQTIPSTTTTTDSRGAPLTDEQARSIIALFFKPGDVDTALKIAKCESTLYPNNINGSSGASGLFQHLPKYWAERSKAAGWENADILDPYANTAVAAWLVYQDGGWSHWTCYHG
jgi:hypothetical protein